MATVGKLFNRKWWWVTLLVILGMGVLAQLGFWQLDRLEQRRAFNRKVTERWNQEPYDLAQGLPDALEPLEWRRVQVEGTFDYEQQIVRTNWPGPNGEVGVLLATPARLDDERAVLVVRGWVPQDLAAPERWPESYEPAGEPVIGLIKQSETENAATVPADGISWYSIDLPLLQAQMPYRLLPVFVEQLPEPGRTLDTFPTRTFNLTLDEGSHLSYAVQWFLFAVILGFGYIQFVRLQETRERRLAEGTEVVAPPLDELDREQPETVAETVAEPAPGVAAPPVFPHEPAGRRP